MGTEGAFKGMNGTITIISRSCLTKAGTVHPY